MAANLLWYIMVQRKMALQENIILDLKVTSLPTEIEIDINHKEIIEK